jgi:mannose/fructose-specific phosphotransferase system component IIA
MVGGILFTHGDIGRELLRTAESILGGQRNVVALSNEGFSASLMEDALSETLKKEGFQEDVVIFVDLARGSCWVAVERIRQKNQNVYLISGVNLPMLLRFFYKRDSLDIQALVEHLREGGTEGIQIRGFFEDAVKGMPA